MTDVAPLTADEMLARSAAAVKSGKTSGKMSAVEKLLAENGDPEDTVQLSPVQKILQAKEKAESKTKNYFESDDYLRMKVGQLRAQLAVYSNLPGLDPNGAVMAGIEAEIRGIIEKQQATLAESQKTADEAKAKLEEAERLKALALPSPDDLIKRAANRLAGIEPETELSAEVKALLEKSKSNVDTTA